MCITLPYSSKVGQSIQRTTKVTDMPRPSHPAAREEGVQTVNVLVLADWPTMQDWCLRLCSKKKTTLPE